MAGFVFARDLEVVSWALRYGYCWIPYDYLTSPDLAADFWAIQAVSPNSLGLIEDRPCRYFRVPGLFV